MTWLPSVLTAVCASCVLIGALQLLCPAGSMAKPVKTVVGLAFLLSVLTAAVPAIRQVEIPSVFPQAQTAEPEELYQASAVYVYERALRAAGIDFTKITVCTDKSEDGSIHISKIVIVSDEQKQRIEAALEGAANEAEVVVTHE